MATTKVIPDVLDLNESTSESGLKIPSGTELNRPATDVAGMIRNNTNETSEGSASCEEYYNGAAWKKINNVSVPPVATENFNTVLYSGNSSTQAITGVGFKPDWVWIKERGPNAENHNVYDSTRGVLKFMSTNNTNAEAAGPQRLQSFDSDGFTLGSDNEINDSASTYVAWCWKANGGTTSSNTDGDITSTVQANQDAGFSIVQFTTNGNAANRVGHGLSQTPDVVLYKQSSQIASWWWYTSLIDGSFDYIKLNAGDAKGDSSGAGFDSTTIFAESGSGGQTMNAYCFHSVDGYSKFGVYTGTGAAGNTVTVGFQPAWVMIKRTNSTGGWLMFDNKRNTSNPRNNRLEANSTQAEQLNSNNKFVDFDATSFEPQVSDAEINASGSTYLYFTFSS